MHDKSTAAAQAAPPAKTSPFNIETVLTVKHWTDRLFSFTTTREPSLRFINGQFVMIGLEVDGRPLLRAYSITSANYEETLEFFSIKVPNGPLTSRLLNIQPGDKVLVGRKPTGTLIHDNLLPGKNLYMLSTGTGIAPFASIIRDPDTYDRFEKVILVHGCREVAELGYGLEVVDKVRNHEFLADYARDKLIHYPTVTREAYTNQGRITDLITSGKLFADIGLQPFSRADDRVMICGSPEMLKDLRDMLLAQNFVEGNSGEPGEFVIEKAFVER